MANQPLTKTQVIELGNYLYENALYVASQWKWKTEKLTKSAGLFRRKVDLFKIILLYEDPQFNLTEFWQDLTININVAELIKNMDVLLLDHKKL